MHCILDNSKICDNCGECHYCDLDPNKICDNCCKCIQKEDADEIEISINDLYATMERQEPFDDDEYVDDEIIEQSAEDDLSEEVFDGSLLEPIEIDPELLAEWERRLAQFQEPSQAAPGKNLHGTRKRRN